MYWIIKNNQLVWFADYEPKKENMLFDEIIKWDFDLSKNYKFENWKIIENTEIVKQKEMTVEEIKEEILKQLWELKQIKDWLELVWEDTIEIETNIEELKQQYNNIGIL